MTHRRVPDLGQALESLHLFYYARGWVHEGYEAFGEALAALLAACGQGPSEPQATASAVPPAAPEPAAEAALHSGVLTEHMDAEVRPGDDFNAYVNGAWMATAEIPPDRPSNSVGLEVHEQATENVRVYGAASSPSFAGGFTNRPNTPDVSVDTAGIEVTLSRSIGSSLRRAAPAARARACASS